MLKIGVIGCGQIASIAHIPLLARIPEVTVAALSDTDPVALARCGLLAPHSRQFADWRQLVASGSVDAVVISLPSYMHTEPATAAFAQGLHVYLEKPIASSVDDALEIADAWRRSGKIGAIGYNYRFNPLYAQARQHVRNGRIGSPLSTVTVFTTPSSVARTWRSARSTGGGAVLDLATHHIDLLRFIFSSEVMSVSATIDSRETEDDSARLELEFECGVSATVTCGFAQTFLDTICITNDGGSLFIDRARSLDAEWRVASKRSSAVSHLTRRLPTPARLRHLAAKLRSPFHEPSFRLALESFIDAVRTGKQSGPNMEDGIAALLVADAAERSAATGLPIAMGSRPDSLAAEAS